MSFIIFDSQCHDHTMLELNFSPFPTLETGRLRLKQMTDVHADDLLTMRADANVMRYIARPLAQKKEDALRLISVIGHSLESNDGITWGIFLKEAPERLMGTIGFWRIQKENYRGEIGYLLHPSLQGKGLMQEAMEKVLDFGFAELKLHSIEAVVQLGNIASIRLLERNGFRKEGHFKENVYYNGKYLDMAVYSLLSTERQR